MHDVYTRARDDRSRARAHVLYSFCAARHVCAINAAKLKVDSRSLAISINQRSDLLTTQKQSMSAFEKAAEDVKKMTQRPSNEEFLELYGMYKQATIGDCNTDRPGMIDMKGCAKWDKWNSSKGMSKEDAEKKYVEVATALIAKYS